MIFKLSPIRLSERSQSSAALFSLASCVLLLSSCDRKAPPAESGAEVSANQESDIGPPSNLTVRNAAWAMNPSYADKSFKRGEILEALGGNGVPVGTVLYPIKFEDFPYPIYLSRTGSLGSPWLQDLSFKFPSSLFGRIGKQSSPLVATDGQPKTSLHLLLKQLTKDGIQLRYRGDFDWSGIRIANAIIARHGAEP